MKKLAALTFASLAALALAACGNSESAKEEAMKDNVEMPAEEAVGGVDAAATPAVDAAATETGTATDAASDAATAAATAAPAAGDGAPPPAKQ